MPSSHDSDDSPSYSSSNVEESIVHGGTGKRNHLSDMEDNPTTRAKVMRMNGNDSEDSDIYMQRTGYNKYDLNSPPPDDIPPVLKGNYERIHACEHCAQLTEEGKRIKCMTPAGLNSQGVLYSCLPCRKRGIACVPYTHPPNAPNRFPVLPDNYNSEDDRLHTPPMKYRKKLRRNKIRVAVEESKTTTPLVGTPIIQLPSQPDIPATTPSSTIPNHHDGFLALSHSINTLTKQLKQQQSQMERFHYEMLDVIHDHKMKVMELNRSIQDCLYTSEGEDMEDMTFGQKTTGK